MTDVLLTSLTVTLIALLICLCQDHFVGRDGREPQLQSIPLPDGADG